MPDSGMPRGEKAFARQDELEDIEILRNLLELRTRLVKEKAGIEIELD